ncbi:MAG: cyclodeaminase/cyclohydrolase family protein [Proteobacteria bacterium]|nr:cyclodeaminase/cyclohydrolase family protein [Pseudomonadota bacterium]
MRMIKDKPIQQFLDELASKAPTPGGGSAAAIMGAMGAALVSMVCNLTLGKKNYADVQGEIEIVLVKSESLRTLLTDMIRADVDVFGQVMEAYGMPRENAEEKQVRADAIQAALKAATDVPLACAKACAEVIALSRIVAGKGNKNVVSDAGVAVLAGHAALKSAALNVYVNVGAINDETFAQDRLIQINALLADNDISVAEVYAMVKSKL